MKLRAEAARAAGLAALLLLAACAAPKPATPELDLGRLAFADLPGWHDDAVAAALPALRRSCASLAHLADDAVIGTNAVAGHARDWRGPCAALALLDATTTDEAARRFFETYFSPFAASNQGETRALVTGYYEPLLEGSRQRGGRYQTPILARPPDLVAVDLGRFRPAWRGERLFGRVVDGRLLPYATRAEIERGALDRFHLALFYAADPIELFFLQIQGSGRIRLPDGSQAPIGYDGENGRAYRALGRLLVERGAMTLEDVSMQSIKAWLAAHPAAAPALLDQNESYVFFRLLPGGGPIGSEGVPLTGGRSLAVDPAFIPLGVPLWLDIAQGQVAMQRLAVAQDTGAAIKGSLRADFFWGFGPDAEAAAGGMRAFGRYYLLLPKPL